MVCVLDETELRWRPAPDQWAVIEVVAHMRDCDERALQRVRRILDEADPELPSFDQDALARERNYLALSLEAELGQYEASRRAHVELLEGLDSAAWERCGIHAEHGRMSIELYEAHVASEDVDHLAQIAHLI